MRLHFSFSFFFSDTATTDIYTLSLHDALPIWRVLLRLFENVPQVLFALAVELGHDLRPGDRSEEHTSELQSRGHLVCRLLLEKKNLKYITKFRNMRSI